MLFCSQDTLFENADKILPYDGILTRSICRAKDGTFWNDSRVETTHSHVLIIDIIKQSKYYCETFNT